MNQPVVNSAISYDRWRAAVGEIADVALEKVTQDADLLQLGLDSIRLMRLTGWLRREGVPVRFAELSSGRTVGEWWEVVRQASPAEAESGNPRAQAGGSSAVAGDDNGGDVTTAPQAPSSESKPFELAVMQHAFWVGREEGQRLGGVAAHFYTEFDRRAGRGSGLDPERLDRAVRALLRRHAMLRVRVGSDGRQRIDLESGWPGLQVHDLRVLPGEEAERRLCELRDRLSHRVMDLASGDVFDVQLSLLAEGTTRMHVNLDMVAADAISLRTLLADLAALYEGSTDGLAPLRYSFRRYLAEREPVRRAARDRAAGWWRQRLPELPSAPALPVMSDDTGGTGPTVTRRHHWLDPDRKHRLAEAARRHGLSPAVALATAFAEVLGRWSAEERFLLNLPVFDREPLHEDVDALVGDFSSSVLLGVDVSGRIGFGERAARVQQDLREAIGQAEYTGVEVLRDLTRAAGGEPVLAPVVFTSALDLGELFAADVQRCFGRPSWIISQGPQVWLDAQATELDGGVLLNWDARESVFPAGVLDDMFAAFTTLVGQLVDEDAAWEQPVPSALPPAQQVVRDRVNDTDRRSRPEPLHRRFFALAEERPELPALLGGGGASAVTSYGELSRRARQVAALLVARGVRQGDRVGITLPKGEDQAVAVLGVLAAGAAYVPSGIDVPMGRRAEVFRTAGATVVLTDSTHAEEPWPADVQPEVVAKTTGFTPTTAPVDVDGEDVMYVLFTSGSTGVPKGVEVPHRALVNTVDAVGDHFDIDATDRTIALSALDFDLSAYDLFAFLSCGGSVVVVQEAQRRDPYAWAELVRAHDVTVVSCVPALLDMLLVAGPEQLTGSRLRLVMLGGDWVGVDLPQRLRELVPGCRFAGLGGMTEAAVHSTVCEVDEIDPAWRAVPYGFPLANTRCLVVDADGCDCPDWVPGELWVSGAGVALGYQGDPDRTAEKFVAHDGRRWYRTGDRARYLPDGMLEFLGRGDHQVKIRGHRIELGEIEAHLAAHPRVNKAVATVVEGATRRLAAAVVPTTTGSPVQVAELRSWLAERVPGYMVPEQVRFLPALPVTSNGKIDRRAVLRDVTEYADHDGSTSATDPTETGPEAPSGDTEEVLALLWTELLGVERVGRHDSFFALGGDSLLATRLVNRLREAGLVGASLATLFTTPNLAGFAATLRPGEQAAAPRLRPDPDHRLEPFALTEVQRAYWIGRDPKLVLGGVASHFYLELDGVDVDLARLEEAWNRLLERHEMLRAVVGTDGTQRILARVPRQQIPLTEAGARPEEALQELRETTSHRVADPATAPMSVARAVHYLDEDGRSRHRIAVSLDSLVLDGRSVLVLFNEWDALYRDPGTPLPSLGISFRDYVMQAGPDERRRTAAEEYWQERLPQLPPAPRLPLAVDPAAVGVPHFRRCHARIEAEAWNALTERARRHQITPTALLLTAYAQVLSAWSNQSDLSVNLTLFDREPVHPDVDGVVGDFSSLLVLGCRLGAQDTVLDSARRVQEQLWRDLDHREVSGVRVLRELARRHDAAMEEMPVVFTSMLGVADDASLDLSASFPAPVYGLTQTPQVWLDLKVSPAGDALAVDWDFVEGLFSPGVAEAMFASYVDLVNRLAETEWDTETPALVPGEQLAVRDRVNYNPGPEPEETLGGGLLHGAFFAQAAAGPDRVAVLWDGGQVSYRELASRVLRTAAWLVEQGVTPGDPVAISLPRGVEQVVALLAVLAAGGQYVPVGMDLPTLRREQLVHSSGAVLVLTDLDVAETTEPLAEPVAVDPSHLAYTIYTSGSTGEPKGVQVTHRSAVNTVDDISTRFDVGPQDRVLAVSATDFDLSVYDVFGLLGAGGSVVVIGAEERRDAQRWVELVHQHRVTVWNSVPALLDMLVTVAETEAGLPSSLRLAMVSGDWVGLDLPGRLRALVSTCRFVALGGATEAAIWSNAFEVERVDPVWPSIPYGHPLRHQRFRVVDRHGRDCPAWVPGELWIGGTGVAAGYRGDPVRTAEKFVMAAGTRWYRTGDLGRYWGDGMLEFLGRSDTQVKVRGHRIELGEIEAALTAHPDVAQAVAVAPGHRDRRRLVAFVQAEAAVLHALPAFLAERLPAHAVPWRLEVLDALPLTANGKVDRNELTRRAEEGSGGSSTPVLQDRAAPAGAEAPTGALEQIVAALWSGLLGVPQVARGDGFFALGGDSLLATQLVSKLSAAGVAGAELANLFLSPTLAGFAATLCTGVAPTTAAVRADVEHRHDPFPLTDVQQAYWIGREAGLSLGGLAAQFHLEYNDLDLDLERLENAWNRLVRRHDMLRAVVDADGTQRILPEVPHYQIWCEDIDPRLGEEERESVLDGVRQQMSRATLDAAAWPLFDIGVVRQGPGRDRLCVALDTLVADGLSTLTLVGEWRQLYEDPDTQLPPLGPSFRDHVLQARPAPEVVEQALSHWCERALPLPSAPRLPLLVPPHTVGVPTFRRRETRLERDCWQRVTQQARQHGITPAVVVLASYADVLARWSEQPDLTVNLPLFDRRQTDPDVHRVVGDFTSLLLASHHPQPGDSWLDRGRRLQEQMWRDLDHRAISGIRVLRELARRRGAPVEVMPVVFTSMLGVDDDLIGSVRWPERTRTQTPQVWLDHQVIERGGELLLSWDAVEELFGDGVLDTMFAEHEATLRLLAETDWASTSAGGLSANTVAAPQGPAPGSVGRLGLSDQPAEPVLAVAPGGAEPVGAVETVLAGLWEELLKVDQVSRADGFFALGGDSLLAARLVSRLRRAGLTGARLERLFATPTLAGFAATLTPGRAEIVTAVQADPEHRHDPFPLTDVQQAYWIGGRDDFVLGGIAALFATERVHDDLDLERLEEAWNRMVQRHDMLRAVVGADSTQRVLPEVPRYEIRCQDLDPDLDGEERREALEALREQMKQVPSEATVWPLFDVRAVREGRSTTRVLVVLNTMMVDGLSMLTLFAEWDRLHSDPSTELTPVGLTFRDHVLREGADPARLAAAEKYWRARVPELPPGPRLPLQVEPDEIGTPRFRRLQQHLGAADWRTVLERAKRHDLTPSVVLLACYAEVLAAWSQQRELTVNLTLFDREPVHLDVDRVVGDFTSLLLVGHHLDPDDTWLTRVRRLQQQVWRDLDHRELSGVRVLRELARRDVRLTEAVPVVFTSMLGVDDAVARSVRWPDHAWSQTPQVWLDHQAVELADGVMLTWDHVDGLFPPTLVEEMFAAYTALLRRLIDTDWALLPAGLPAGTAPTPAPVPRSVSRSSGPDRGPTVPRTPPGTVLEQELCELWAEVLGTGAVSRRDNFFALGGDSLTGTRMVQSAAERYAVDLSLRAFFAEPTVAWLASSIADQLTATETSEEGVL